MKNDIEIAELKAENEFLKQQNQWLLAQLKLSNKRNFGASSEKLNADISAQLSLFNEAEQENDGENEPDIKDVKAYRRRKAGQVGIGKLPEDLPVEIIEHSLPGEDQFCPDCGEALHVMGRETREELKLVPAKAVILRHETLTYSCRHCERRSEYVPMVKAKTPEPVIKKSFASPEAVAHIAYEKFVMGSPLYRQQQDWERKGIPLSRQTMSNWLIKASADWLQPIYDRLKKQLISAEVLHADETTVQVLREDGRHAENKSYMWLYRTGADANNHIVLYDYQPGRSGDYARDFLKGFKGYLHTDGLKGYHCKLPEDIIVVGCWAHVRRNFNDALMTLPKNVRKKSQAAEALLRLGEIYKLEEEFRKFPEDNNFKARFEARKEHVKPLIDAFYEWCSLQTTMPGSPFKEAVTYCLNQKPWLDKFLLDGRLEIDNNRAERSIKPFVIGRKNWLFSNTPNGAHSSAILYSIIETAKENKVNPFDYLTFVFRNAPNWDIHNHPEVIDKLLPWNFTPNAAY
ncbi:MAG: IS66 family transposase [Firmicutes bacterium]|nr:IS66 family transposase [Bacillota bacterium]